MKTKLRDADKGTGRPHFFHYFLALRCSLRVLVSCIDRRSTVSRTYIAIPSFLDLPGLIIPNGADFSFVIGS